MKVLIVDPKTKRLLETSRILELAGYQVMGAATGRECLRIAREKRPDLILLGMALSDISGIDLAKQIKRDPGLARIHVALLSAAETPSSIRARGMESGADECIERDMPKREFLARVAAMLRRKEAEDALRVSQQEWEAAFHAIGDPVFVTDLEFRILHCNLAMARFLGEAPSKVIGRYCYELVHGAPEPIAACLLNRVRETQVRESLVVAIRDRWLCFSVDPLLDEDDNLVGSVHILTDVTEHRRVEGALAQARADMDKQTEEHGAALAAVEERLQTELADRQGVEEALAQARAEMEKQTEEHGAALGAAEETLQAEVGERKQVEEALAQARAEMEKQAEEHRAALGAAEERLQTELAERKQVEEALAQTRAEMEKQTEEHRAALGGAEERLQTELAERQGVEEALAQARAEVAKQADALAAAEGALRAGLSAIAPDKAS